MTFDSDDLTSGSASAQDRFSGGVSAFRQSRRESMGEPDEDGLPSHRDGSELPTRSRSRSGSLPASLEPTSALDRAAALPSLDLQGLAEPAFGWTEASPSMADHPLLRGLLLELPPRGVNPPSQWLDRWFEAVRSILELLYVEGSKQ